MTPKVGCYYLHTRDGNTWVLEFCYGVLDRGVELTWREFRVEHGGSWFGPYVSWEESSLEPEWLQEIGAEQAQVLIDMYVTTR